MPTLSSVLTCFGSIVNERSSFTDWEGGKQVDNAFDRSFDFGRNRVADLNPGADANAACKEAA